jgi:hypothetical protein
VCDVADVLVGHGPPRFRKHPRTRGPPILRPLRPRLRDNPQPALPSQLPNFSTPRTVTVGAHFVPLYGNGPDRYRTAKRARHGGSRRGNAWPASLAATPVPRSGSRRVPARFRPLGTRSRQESWFLGADPALPGTVRNSRGTRWGLNRNRRTSGSSRMGTEWGLGPFTIEQTTEDVTSMYRLAASRHPRATATSPPAAGLGHRAAIRGTAAPRPMSRAERAIRTAPNPGTS